MQKVYLLLRSNKQTGPYSLEELLQLNLKPFDLVWVEGRSGAWQYPSEIPSLQPYVPETPQAEVPYQPIATSVMEEKPSPTLGAGFPDQKTETPKRVFVSIPKTHTAESGQKTYAGSGSYAQHKAYMPPVEERLQERKEEPVPTPPSFFRSSSPYQYPGSSGDEAAHTNYSRSLHDVEEDYTNWVYKQKTKKKTSVTSKDLVLTALILAVIGGGYYIISKPSAANSVLPSNQTATQAVQQSAGNKQEEPEPKEILSPEQRVTDANDRTQTTPTRQAKNIKTKNPVIVSKSQTSSSVPQMESSMPAEKTSPNIHDNDIASGEPQAKQPAGNTPAEKKKKFGEVLKDIFSKKTKKEEPQNGQVVLEDPKPANNRQATRRETDDHSSGENSGSNEMNTASLMEQIDLSSNAPDSWMMGVKNLKVTLRNRSNVAIQTALVTVNYYDQNNQLLEKKLIYFNNVAPKSKATVAAPDQKFADHADFKLTSVSAKEDRYAKY